jgi:hypothetical protein
METVAAVAAIVAASTGIVTLRVAVVEAKRRRLTEIIDLITQMKAAIDWGPGAAVRRDEFQGQLRTRIGGLDLPRTRELANEQLHGTPEFSELAASALAKARCAIDGLRLISLPRAK